jgi:hypothetical protein
MLFPNRCRVLFNELFGMLLSIGRLLCRPRPQRAQLGYVYFKDEPGRQTAAKLLADLQRTSLSWDL